MDMSDLIPWKKEKSDVQIRRENEEDALLDIRNQMNRMFDDFFERPFGLTPFVVGWESLETLHLIWM